MDKKKLLKARPLEAEVDVPDVGTIKVRALTRADVLAIADAQRNADRLGDRAYFEQLMLASALVDPALTADEVAEWQAVAPSKVIGTVVDAVTSLAALTPDAAKDMFKEMQSDPDVEFRVLAG